MKILDEIHVIGGKCLHGNITVQGSKNTVLPLMAGALLYRGINVLKACPRITDVFYMEEILPQLDYWKRYEELSDDGQFEAFKQQLLQEINALHIEGLPEVKKLNALVGKYVNLAYPLPNGKAVQFLDDDTTYLGNQLESAFGGDRCFGILASMDFLLICTYEKDGINPELVLYKKR